MVTGCIRRMQVAMLAQGGLKVVLMNYEIMNGPLEYLFFQYNYFDRKHILKL